METTLRIIKNVLDHAPGVKGYALIGAMAMGAWVRGRATMDLDILVGTSKRPKSAIDHVRLKLTARGWSVAQYSHEHETIPHRIRTQTPKGFMADLIFAHAPIHHRIIDSSQPTSVGKRLRFPVAGPEGIIVLKLIAGRRQDLIDVERLLTEAKLDKTLLFSLAKEAGTEPLLKRAAKQAGWQV